MCENLESQICSRCLLILNVTSRVIARDYKGNSEQFSDPTNPRALRRWVQEKMWGEGNVMILDTYEPAFEPVGTYMGDAVCGWHLHECIRRERESQWSRRGR